MKCTNSILTTVLLVGLFIVALDLSAAAAEPPPTPHVTLWQRLGIPQGARTIRDARLNRSGERPDRERTDPLLRIADPANIKSDNPAIRVAAEAKADADLAEQKVKAIRYLAEVGCECSSQSDTIEEALLAALDDCEEEVRYEAALAFCGTAGETCSRCNRKSCCSVESIKKLHKIATGMDDNGCWQEKSSKVRQVAGAAFDRCRRSYVSSPKKPVDPDKPADPKETSGQPYQEDSDLGGGLEGESAAGPEPFDAELEALLSAPSTGMGASLGAAAGIASAVGGASGPQGNGLYMLGDSLGATGGVMRVNPPEYIFFYQDDNGDDDYVSIVPSQDPADIADVPIPPAFYRTVKIAENYSSIPRDRFFFNYSLFKDPVLGTPHKISDINRFVFGAEKTFFNELTSLEVRVPFGATVNSNQRLDYTDFSNIEYGNTVLIGKAILLQSERYTFTAGLGIGLPTADDTHVFGTALNNFNELEEFLLLTLENDAIHLAPFLGVAATLSKNTFLESFIQVDMAMSENDVHGLYLGENHQLKDQAILFADLSIGYWLYRNSMSRKILKGIAPVVELHYSTSIEDADTINDARVGTIITNSEENNFHYLNMTCGTHFLFGNGGTISPGVVIPMLGKDRRQFDYELQLQVNLPY